MLDNNKDNIETSENTDIKSRENLAPEVAKTPEVVGRSGVPQSATRNDDKTTAQKIQKNLQNSQVQQTSNAGGNPQVQSPATTKGAVGDEPYIKAAENVIEKDKEDPYKEEEDHEDVQIQYLKDRFGKDIKRS